MSKKNTATSASTVMLEPLFDIAPLEEPIQSGALIITSNLRLSRKIRDTWNDHCAQQGQSQWVSPQIMPLDTWLQESWLQLVDAAFEPALTGTLIKPHQSQWLWEQSIAADPAFSGAAHAQNFAELANKGWQLIQQWELTEAQLSNSHHDGAKMLQQWGQHWQQQLTEYGLISPEQRTQIVTQGFNEGILNRLSRICLIGFQSISPHYQKVLKSACSGPEHVQVNAQQQRLKQLSVQDIDTEIANAAQWAKQRMVENPQARIGIVVPDLARLRNKVERIFLHHFDPHWCWPNTTYRPLPFNISATTPLAETPLVSAALSLLNLNRQQLSSADAGQLLNNPFWGQSAEEGAFRAQVYINIRQTNLHTLNLSLFRRMLSSTKLPPSEDTENTLSLTERLLRLATEQRQRPAKLSFSEWRKVFEKQLTILGWPGDRGLNSLEYQQREHWYDMLEQFELLDTITTPVPVEAALKQLQRLALNTGFQAETPDAQVQILGTLEAAGLHFSHLWVMQMDDRHWPAATEPHPLLPVALQRQLGMPRACPQRELALSNSLFELFCSSANEVIFSYATHEGDIQFQASALLADINPQSLNNEPESITGLDKNIPLHPLVGSITASSTLEIIDDHQGPDFVPSTTPIGGATGFISAQANCPFNAFALYRLGAAPIPEPTLGLSPLSKGNLIHYSLEAFWRTLNGSAALHKLTETEREQQLTDAIETAFSDFIRQSPLSIQELGKRHLDVEKNRIHHLLSEWLELELSRAEFELLETEKSCELNLDGFILKMRIDRLDRLSDGSQAVIDYKTGNVNVNNLGSDRLIEPQLALYALAIGEPLAAVAYGQIQAKNIGIKGLAIDGHYLPGTINPLKAGIDDTWSKILEKWYNQLINIKNEIASGQASVTFYSTTAQAYGQHLEPLNRWPGHDQLSHYLNEHDSELNKDGDPS